MLFLRRSFLDGHLFDAHTLCGAPAGAGRRESFSNTDDGMRESAGGATG
jgi:hypothetical protein